MLSKPSQMGMMPLALLCLPTRQLYRDISTTKAKAVVWERSYATLSAGLGSYFYVAKSSGLEIICPERSRSASCCQNPKRLAVPTVSTRLDHDLGRMHGNA